MFPSSTTDRNLSRGCCGGYIHHVYKYFVNVENIDKAKLSKRVVSIKPEI